MYSSSRKDEYTQHPESHVDDHALVHWPEEECVSVVPISNIIEPPVVGKASQVRVGKKIYEETISRFVRLYDLHL